MSVTNKAFTPRGWVKIEVEWIYYDGYDNAEVDTKYRLRNCVRGQLGTTAVAHLAAVTVYNKVAKIIAPASVLLENDPLGGSAYVPLRYGTEYSYDVTLGCFVLSGDAAGTYRATFSVYDSDQSINVASTVYSIEDIIDRLVRAQAAYGGAGYDPADCTWDVTGLYITRFEYDPDNNAEYAWQCIQDVIDAIGLTEQYRFWYDHSTGVFRFGLVSVGAVDYTIDGVTGIQSENSIEECYSGVLVKYTSDQILNRVNPTYSHYLIADGGITPARPDYYRAVASGGENYEQPSPVDYTAAGNAGIEYIVDSRKDSKLMGIFEANNPGASFDFAHFYFGTGAVPPVIRLNRVSLTVGVYRGIEGWSRTRYRADYNYEVRLEGCDDYNSTTHVGTWRDLGCSMQGTPGSTATTVTGEFDGFALSNVNAVRIMFNYMAGPLQAGDYYWGAVHEFSIDGDSSTFVFVQTSDTVKDDPLFLYAPSSHYKLRGGMNSASGAGCPRVLVYDAGGTSEGAAISLGRLLLTTKLAKYSQRIYQYQGTFSTTLPELGDTIAIDEDNDGSAEYTGILMGISGQIQGSGGTAWTLRVFNPDVEVIQT